MLPQNSRKTLTKGHCPLEIVGETDQENIYRATRKAQARYWWEITGRNDKSMSGGEDLMETSQSEVALELFEEVGSQKAKKGEEIKNVF